MPLFAKKKSTPFTARDLRSAAQVGDLIKVRACLAEFEGNGTLYKILHNPDPAAMALYGAISYIQYEAGLLLLEAGCDPMFRNERGLCPFLFSMTFGGISFVKLLLWFNPDYTNVLDDDNKTTAAQVIERFNHRYPGYKDKVEQTVADVKKVGDLKAQANNFVATKQFAEALTCAEEIAKLYEKHGTIEEGRTVREQPLVAYYRRKAIETKYIIRQLIDNSYQATIYPDNATLEQHKIILHELADLACKLNKSAEAIAYSSRLAHFLIPSSESLVTKSLTGIEASEVVQNPLISRKEESTPLLSGLRRRHHADAAPVP